MSSTTPGDSSKPYNSSDDSPEDNDFVRDRGLRTQGLPVLFDDKT